MTSLFLWPLRLKRFLLSFAAKPTRRLRIALRQSLVRWMSALTWPWANFTGSRPLKSGVFFKQI